MSASSQYIHQIVQFGDHRTDFVGLSVKVIGDTATNGRRWPWYGEI